MTPIAVGPFIGRIVLRRRPRGSRGILGGVAEVQMREPLQASGASERREREHNLRGNERARERGAALSCLRARARVGAKCRFVVA